MSIHSRHMKKWLISLIMVSMFASILPGHGYLAYASEEEEPAAAISGITLNSGNLTPSFSPEQYVYTVNVYELTSVQIAATVTDDVYGVLINGIATVGGTAVAIPLTQGADHTIEVKATSDDDSSHPVYTLNIVNGPTPAEGTVNIAAGKPIIAASSSLTGSEIMTNGSKSGSFSSGNWQLDKAPDSNAYFILDLGANYVLDDIVITRTFMALQGHIKDYKIYGSQTTVFTPSSDLLAQTPNAANTDITTGIWEGKINPAFASNKYRYLKFEKLDGWSSVFKEVEVYGYPLPEISAVNIVDGADSVPAASAFVIDFNVDMDTSLFTSEYVTITEDNEPIAYTPEFTNRQFIIPSGTFSTLREYVVTIPATLTDLLGNSLTAGRTISFRTIDAERSEFYIALDGDDSGSGTIDAPFASIEGAKLYLRTLKPNMSLDYTVYLRGGTYAVTDPIVLDDRDSGENGFTITYQAYPGETPIIDGGRSFEGAWQWYGDGIYRMYLDGIEDMRELYMDDVRQPRASTDPLYSAPVEGNKRKMMFRTSDLPLGGIAHPEDVFYYQNHNWRTYMMPVQSFAYDTEFTTLHFREPHITTFLTKFNHEMKYTAWARLENAPEFINQEGEWYYDKRTHYLYYKPVVGMDLAHAEVYVPQASELMRLQGRTMQTKLHDVAVKGITFQGASWLAVNEKGFASTQTTYIVDEAGAFKNQLPAGIHVNHARDIVLERNVLKQFGKSGINMEQGIRDIRIEGNLFVDLAGGAIAVGSTDHMTIDPATEELPTNITIANNVLREIGVEFQSSAAITSAYSENLSIVHNDIDGVNYSGISVGWGFSANTTTLINTLVGYNKVHNFNRKTVDGAGIYSLSRHVNSAFRGNYVKNVFVPNNSGALYHDERSRGFLDEDNVVEIERGDYANYTLNNVDDITIRNLYSTTGNMLLYRTGPGLVIEEVHIYPDADWPEPALQIIENAGLEPDYRDLLNEVPSIVREMRPHIRSSGIEYIETMQFEPSSTTVDAAAFTAPHMEDNGIVVMEAKDYTGFVGLEAADYSYIGVLGGWLSNMASQYALLTRGKSFEREQTLEGKPVVSYDVQFQTPGTYYLLVRGYSQSSVGKIRAEFEGQTLGDLSFPTHFAFVNEVDGIPITVQVPQAGQYTLTLTALDATVETYLDRVALTQTLTDELHDGSTALGPLNSSRLNQPEVVIPIKLSFPEFVQLNERNYSPGQAVSASSSAAPEAEEAPIDESIYTSWRSAPADDHPEWQIDLSETVSLYRLELAFAEDADRPEERRNLAIHASNDASFADYETIGEVGAAGVAYKSSYVVKPAGSPEYRYIRIVKTVAGEPLSLSEMRTYSTADSRLTNVALGRKVIDASAPNHEQLEAMGPVLTDAYTSNSWTLTPSLTESTYFVLDLLYEFPIHELTLSRPQASFPQQISGMQVFGSNYSDFSDNGTLLFTVPDTVDPTSASWTGKVEYRTETYRYLKFVKPDQIAIALSEVEVWSRAPIDLDAVYINAAEGKPIVDVAARDAASLAANRYKLTDGEATNWLLSQGTEPLPYYTIDMGSAVSIDKVRLVREYPAVPNHSNNIVIVGDEDGDFSEGAELLSYIPLSYKDTSTNVWSGYILNPKPFRYFKVAKQANGDLFLRDIELLVKQPPTPETPEEPEPSQQGSGGGTEHTGKPLQITEQLNEAAVTVDMGESIAAIPAEQWMRWRNENPETTVEFSHTTASYSLPLKLIDTKAIAVRLGVSERELQLVIRIEFADEEALANVEQAVEGMGGSLVAPLIEFKVMLVAHDGRAEELSRFDGYVARTIRLSDELQAGYMVGLIVNPVTGALSPVPTTFSMIDGQMAARLQRQGNSLYTVIRMDKSFDDMRGHWARADVELLASKLLVRGISESDFNPESDVTRAEFAAMLSRGLALNESDQRHPFTDVSSEWFAADVAKLADAGLVLGFPGGEFRPYAHITRQEMAVLLMRARAKIVGKLPSTGSSNVMASSRYNDMDAIADWAKPAMEEAVRLGVMQGTDQGMLHPHAPAARAEAAVMLKRLLTEIQFLSES